MSTTGWVRQAGAVITSAESAPTAATLTIPPNTILMQGYRSFRCMVFGDTANDDADFELYGVESQHPSGGPTPVTPLYISRLILTSAAVLIGADAGAAADPSLLSATELFADTYPTPTIAAYGARLLANFNGSADVFSPTGDGIGEVFISDVGNVHGILPVFQTLNTGDYFGVIYRLDT